MFDYNSFIIGNTEYECIETTVELYQLFEYFLWYNVNKDDVRDSQPIAFNVDYTIFFDDYENYYLTEYWIEI